MTTKQAADALGLTKNQVIGLRYRERQRAKREPTPEVKMSAVTEKRKFVSVVRPTNLPPKVVLQRVEVPASMFDAPAGKINVACLENRHCKFICDDGYFCGQNHIAGSPYCAEHHARCYVKPIIHKGRTTCNSAPRPFKLSAGVSAR